MVYKTKDDPERNVQFICKYINQSYVPEPIIPKRQTLVFSCQRCVSWLILVPPEGTSLPLVNTGECHFIREIGYVSAQSEEVIATAGCHWPPPTDIKLIIRPLK